jgi:hypothetical protein
VQDSPEAGSVKSSWPNCATFVETITSVGRSESGFCRNRKPMSELAVLSVEPTGCGASLELSIRDTITRSAPSSRAALIGTLSASPPSMSIRSPMRTGVKTSGMAKLARTACARSPERSTTRSFVARSAAMARKGTGNESKSPRAVRLPRSIIAFISATTSPSWSAPFCSVSWPPLVSHTVSGRRPTPTSGGMRGRYGWKRLPIGYAAVSESISRPVYPLAYNAPTIDPMLVPITMSGWMPRLSSTRITPMCAAPFAPPPARTSAVLAGAHTTWDGDARLDCCTCARTVPIGPPIRQPTNAARDTTARVVTGAREEGEGTVPVPCHASAARRQSGGKDGSDADGTGRMYARGGAAEGAHPSPRREVSASRTFCGRSRRRGADRRAARSGGPETK